jgi:hypothetical protein
MSEQAKSRRDFLKLAAVGAAALPAGAALLRAQDAVAQDLPKLAEDDPAAQALGYVHDASAVDAAKYPRYEQGQLCSNCMQIQGEEGAQWRPCAIFPGKLVNADGWCSVWVPKG